MNGKNKSHNKIDVQSASQEALLYVFEDNEAVTKMICERQKSHNEMFPELTEMLLIGCSIELIWDPNIQIKYIDTKNQLADILTKREFHTWWMESFVELVWY